MINKTTLRIGWFLLLIAITLIGDRVGGYFLQRIVDKSNFRYTSLYQGKAQADILLVGNSRGLSFYQPHVEEATQKTTFNLSYNGMPVDLARVLVEDYFERHPAPALVLIDITLSDKYNIPLISGFTAYSTYSKRLDSLIQAVNPKLYYACKFSHLLRFNNEVFLRALYYQGNTTDKNWLLDRVISDGMREKVTQEPYKIDLIKIEELKAIIKIAQENGSEVKLTVTPYYPPFRHHMEGLDKFIAAVEEHTQLPVHDYSTALSNYEFFGDYMHINKDGSKSLIQLLQQDGIL